MAETERRRIGVVIGSASDLAQCKPGLELLLAAAERGEIEIVDGGPIVSSILRNQQETLDLVDRWVAMEDFPNVIITGAGWANQLPGVVAARLRYVHWDTRIAVAGVGFKDPGTDRRCERHTRAAELSITELRGSPILVTMFAHVEFFGEAGFTSACKYSMYGNLGPITLPEPRSVQRFTMQEAIELASEMQAKAV